MIKTSLKILGLLAIFLGLAGCTVDGQITDTTERRAIKQEDGENRMKISPGSMRMAGMVAGARVTITPNLKRSVGTQTGAVLSTSQNKLSSEQ